MSDPNTPAIVASWEQLRASMQLEALKFARHAFDAILNGQPLTIHETAKAVGVGNDEAHAFVVSFERAGLMNLDGNIIVGSLGLTTQKTKYSLTINDRDLHVWCALDAVGIPAALDADAQVHVDGVAEVQIAGGKLAHVSPNDLRISLADPFIADDMRQQICPKISFHRRAGATHGSMAWLTVDEAMELGKTIWARPNHANTRSEETP